MVSIAWRRVAGMHKKLAIVRGPMTTTGIWISIKHINYLKFYLKQRYRQCARAAAAAVREGRKSHILLAWPMVFAPPSSKISAFSTDATNGFASAFCLPEVYQTFIIPMPPSAPNCVCQSDDVVLHLVFVFVFVVIKYRCCVRFEVRYAKCLLRIVSMNIMWQRYWCDIGKFVQTF